MADKCEFSLGQSVTYRGKLYRVTGARVMGVTGWRYDLEDDTGNRVEAAWGYQISAVGEQNA